MLLLFEFGKIHVYNVAHEFTKVRLHCKPEQTCDMIVNKVASGKHVLFYNSYCIQGDLCGDRGKLLPPPPSSQFTRTYMYGGICEYV